MLTAYADALEAGRLGAAHRLLDPSVAGTLDAFEARYADPERRRARAAEIRASLSEVRTSAPGVAAVKQAGGGGFRVVDAAPAEARQALERFLDAADAADFEAAYRLLSGTWRASYTPERLRADFEAEPQARERLARARAALFATPSLSDGAVVFPIGDGRAVRLVREGDAFRVAALE